MGNDTAGGDLSSVRALIVDRHRMFADVIRPVLEAAGMRVLRAATNGPDAVAAAARSDPTLVLLDLGLPDRAAVSVGKRLMDVCPGVKILAVTDAYDARSAREVIEAGFHGCLTKDVPLNEFVDSIRIALAGTMVVTGEASRRARSVHPGDPPREELLAARLTPRERQVLSMLVEGAAGPEIAARLPIGHHTLHTHVGNILWKLGVHSRLEAAAFAVRHGLTEAEDDRSPWNADRPVPRRGR